MTISQAIQYAHGGTASSSLPFPADAGQPCKVRTRSANVAEASHHMAGRVVLEGRFARSLQARISRLRTATTTTST